MKRIIAVICVLACLVAFTACGGTGNAGGGNLLAGTWNQKDGQGVLYFGDDKTGSSENDEFFTGFETFTYEAAGSALTFVKGDAKLETTHEIKDNQLYITKDDVTVVYVKMVAVGGVSGPESVETKPTDATSSEEAPPTDDKIGKSIIGTWVTTYEGYSLTYTFAEDGTGTAVSGAFPVSIPITWSVKDGVITITGSGFGDTDTGSASYSLGDDTLTVNKDGETHVFTRQG